MSFKQNLPLTNPLSVKDSIFPNMKIKTICSNTTIPNKFSHESDRKKKRQERKKSVPFVDIIAYLENSNKSDKK